MVISSLNRLESEPTPPTTPLPNIKLEVSQPLGIMEAKTCVSKNCMHKQDNVIAKTPKSAEKQKPESDLETNDSDDSGSSTDSEDTGSSSESEPDIKSRKKSHLKTGKNTSKAKGQSKKRIIKEKKVEYNREERKDGQDGELRLASIDSSSTDDAAALRTALSKKGNTSLRKLLQRALRKEPEPSDEPDKSEKSDKSAEKGKKKKKVKTVAKAEFKRLDEIWDEELYDYKLKETVEDKTKDEYEQYIFTVRRKFDNENHYEETVVDIRSQELRQCLQAIMDGVEGVSLVEDTPRLEPNMLFLFLDEFKAQAKILTEESLNAKKKKIRKIAAVKAKYLEVLISYLDQDYEDIKKTLYPLLNSGRISFELLWALYKPNTLAFTTTYGDDDQPRAFRIVSANKTRTFSRGVFYEIEGKGFDYNGKHFGSGDCYSTVTAFKGTRKITSLACYPLQYHSNVDSMKQSLLERGKRFLTLAGMNYKNCKGMAYVKKQDKVLKASVNGRIMIDPGTFRRINPNYELNDIEPRITEVNDEGECSCHTAPEKPKQGGRLFRLINSGKDDAYVIEVKPEEQADLEQHIDSAEKERDLLNTFTEEEVLTASAVLPGFSFSEKSWLEFAVSTVSDVTWNAGAFDSLVLPEKHKSIVKALVSAHGLHSSKGIDDVIAGKGKGLVAVLHGRPGLGKTLTCEAVSDLLKRPLYTVTAGDLGTNPTQLEAELQAILDIAHTWGAVLLLDEADVFLEERSIHDVHRNALVSIFLRLLEYFQGILFLTTNRVGTFDEAFVSRIHLSLRYGDLTTKAKKAVWRTFVDKVRAMEDAAVEEITETDYNDLARHDMNGRQIKNLVKTAQALALHEGVSMKMEHIRRVIEVARDFEMDLKGGRGYEEAMRSYS